MIWKSYVLSVPKANVTFDDLRGEGESGKARELIMLLERKKCIESALEIMKKKYPNVSWPNLNWMHEFRTYQAVIKAQFGRIDKNLLLIAERLHRLGKQLRLLSREDKCMP